MAGGLKGSVPDAEDNKKTSVEEKTVRKGALVGHRKVEHAENTKALMGAALINSGNTVESLIDCLDTARAPQKPAKKESSTISENSAALMTDKLASCLGVFPEEHPFYPPEVFISNKYLNEMRDIVRELDTNQDDKLGIRLIQFTLLLTEKYSGENPLESNVFKALSFMPFPEFDALTEILNLYHKLSATNPASLDASDLSLGFSEFKKNTFIPGIWLLIKLAIEHGKECLVSPIEIIDLIKHMYPRHLTKGDPFSIARMQILMFSKDYKSICFFFRRKLLDHLCKEEIETHKLSSTPTYIKGEEHFLSVIALAANQELAYEKIDFLRGLSGLSKLQYRVIYNLLRIAVLTPCNPIEPDSNKKQILDYLWDHFSPGESKQSYLYKKMDKIMNPKDSEKDFYWKRLYKESKEQFLNCTDFYLGVFELVIGIGFLYGTSYRANPLWAADSFVKAAEFSGYPMLYRNAGEIYMGLRDYQKAIGCFRNLLSFTRIGEYDREALNDLIELCQYKKELYENIDRLVLDVDGSGIDNKTLIAEAREEDKKTEGMVSYSDCTKTFDKPSLDGSSVDIINRSEQDSGSVGFSNYEAPAKPIRTNDVLIVSDDSSCCSKIHSHDTERNYYSPEGSWLHDDDPVMKKFFAEINQHRDEFDRESEKKCIEDALEMVPSARGRIFEESIWFYIDQVMVNHGYPSFKPVVLNGDSAETIKDVYSLAGKWLSKSLACYLRVSVPENIRHDELHRIVDTYNNASFGREYDAALRKRLRSIASAGGHLQGILVRNSSGKQQAHHKANAIKFFNIKRMADPEFYQRK